MMTLSQVLAYNVDHLEEAAEHWEKVADHRESTFAEVRNQAYNLNWSGDAADAMREHVGWDTQKAVFSGDDLREAARIARTGASDLSHLRQRLLYNLEDVQGDGYAVGEDYTALNTQPTNSLEQAAERQQRGIQHTADLRAKATELTEADAGVGARLQTATAGEGKVTFTDFKHDAGNSATPESPTNTVVDPNHPFVGDERFGQWENYSPPPYTGTTPPPPAFEHRPLDGVAAKPGGPSNFYTPGRTWVADSDAPFASQSEAYKFRMTGQDLTSYTRTVTVDGHQQVQRWVANTYEAQRISKVDVNGSIWSKNAPGTPGTLLPGTGGVGGLALGEHFGPWHAITPNQMANLSAINPTATYYIPDGCGGAFSFAGGVPVGGVAPPPTVPVMTAPR